VLRQNIHPSRRATAAQKQSVNLATGFSEESLAR
jgi:hypothetical protein